MDPGEVLLVLLVAGLISGAALHPVLPSVILENLDLARSDGKFHTADDDLYCDSWRFSVETNDAGPWKSIPARCVGFVKEYMTGAKYASDLSVVADDSLSFAREIEISGDGKDAWVFDVDETLLSNLPYYAFHGFGSEEFDEKSFDEWTSLAECPAIPPSLKLYKHLLRLGFKVILLTGRTESQRNATGKNLLTAGYQDWHTLILRGTSDIGKDAVVYKSEARQKLEAEGYRIRGSSGDQWSDLFGFPKATRSFKLPNPMYYVS